MTNSEVLNNQITLQAISASLDLITRSLGSFATKEDLDNFAKKYDFENFATKDDLKNFATKEDLKNFATKDDLKNFATKDDLNVISTHLEDLIDSLAITTMNEFARLHAKFDSLEAKVDRNHGYTVNQFDYVFSHYALKEEYRQFATR